jgi:polyhydroxybutyrate depolymerase
MATSREMASRVVWIAVATACSNGGGGNTRHEHDARIADALPILPLDAAAPDAASCPSTSLPPGDTTEMIMVNGIARSYLLHVPASYTGASPAPLVIDLHPKGVDAATWTLATTWTTVSDQQGFILVRPNGHGMTWNVGRCCEPAMSAVDDVAFVRAMVAALEQKLCIDAKRIYASGCSNGGGMSYKLACDAADLIAAIAPVDFDCMTGPTNSPSCGSCSPSRPISAIQFRGLLDSSVPYGGGPTDVVPGLEFPGAEANFSTWGMLNQCTGSAQTDPASSACKTYPSCGGGVETTLCSNPLGLHCLNYSQFHIAETAWQMFSRQHLP